MIKTTVVAALFAAALGGAAQAGTDHSYTDADRSFYADYNRRAGAPAQAPRQQDYQGGFGSFSAAGTARTLGY